MATQFARGGITQINDLQRSIGALVGIAQGLICDGNLNDREIAFLDQWLSDNEGISKTWPGDVIHERIRYILADGIVSEEERDYLSNTLQQLIGGTFEELSSPTHVTELAFDYVKEVDFLGARFCLTGEFVFASRDTCAAAIERRGGIVSKSVTKKVQYVVVGGLGSNEWKHGSFGTKLDLAMKLKREGVPLKIVSEDCWANSLSIATA